MEQSAIIIKTGREVKVVYANDGLYINLDDGDLYFGYEIDLI